MTFTSHKSQISARRVTNTWTKEGFFVAEKIFFKQDFQLKQFSLTFEAMLMWFPSGFVGCTTDLIDKRHRLKEEHYEKIDWEILRKEKETKEILPILP